MLFTFLFFVSFFIFGIYELSNRIYTIANNNKNIVNIYDENTAKENLNIYIDVNENINKPNKDNVLEENIKNNKKKEMNFTALGEIMMGGRDFSSYSLPYKEISEYTKKADYTVANFTTNITSLKKIENPKTKYIVKKDILNTFKTLGIDAVNIANDHALDFGRILFNTTKTILKKDELDIIGLKNNIVYAESNGIRVAFIGTCNEVIGMQSYYEDAGIFMYNYKEIEEQIKQAKTKADTVIVMVHLGLENEYKKTSIMTWYYKKLIDFGADAVLGSHALGVYPVETYKSKPIIYSLGYLMHDTDQEIGKQSAIFNFTVDIKGKITKLKITPTYIKDKKESVLYYEYNKNDAITFLNKIGSNIKSKNKKIENGKLEITFK